MGKNVPEEGQEQQQPLDSPMEVTDMIELTPEGIQDNFSRLQELMNNYRREEGFGDVRVRLDYGDGPSSTPVSGGMMVNSAFTFPTGGNSSTFIYKLAQHLAPRLYFSLEHPQVLWKI
jgi:hypothetical protein